jgi:uncharacterized protein YbjQ (UPF0145 family)
MTIELVMFVVLLVVGGGAGRVQERRHERSLDRREEAIAGVTVTDLREAPPSITVADASFVAGEVVIAADFGKHVVARLRNLVGGEVRSLRRMIDRGRREALVRMKESARERGADLVLNVRFDTTMITDRSAEVLCYGTAVRRR